MRASLSLVVTLAAAVVMASLGACGSSNEGSGTPTFNTDAGDASKALPDASHKLPPPKDSGSPGQGDGANAGATMSNVTLTPANKTITVAAGQTATQAYQVMAVLDGQGAPVDVTSRFVFYVPDNYLVGDFPANGARVAAAGRDADRAGRGAQPR